MVKREIKYKRSNVSFNNKGKIKTILIMFGVLNVIAMSAICIGAYYIPLNEVFTSLTQRILLEDNVRSIYYTIVWDIRLSRIILAIGVGVSLSSSGVVYQGIFKNPLIEPYILGVSSGSAFGAALAIVFRFPYSMQILAFIFGLIAVFTTYSLARIKGETVLVTLILSGIIIGSLFSAMVSIFQYIGTEEQLKKLVFWLMGGLYHATWNNIFIMLPIVFMGFFIFWFNSWKLNVLSMGEDEAKSLGIQTEKIKIILLVTATAITAISVSVVGIIGWVGLMIPHAARMIVGPDHRFLLPLSAIMGSIFMIICDTIARTISTGEVPIGIVTAIIGAPYLLYLIRRKSNYFGG